MSGDDRKGEDGAEWESPISDSSDTLPNWDPLKTAGTSLRELHARKNMPPIHNEEESQTIRYKVREMDAWNKEFKDRKKAVDDHLKKRLKRRRLLIELEKTGLQHEEFKKQGIAQEKAERPSKAEHSESDAIEIIKAVGQNDLIVIDEAQRHLPMVRLAMPHLSWPNQLKVAIALAKRQLGRQLSPEDIETISRIILKKT